MNGIIVSKAKYLENYKIKIVFSDNTSQIIDFEPFLKENPHPQWDKYIDLTIFKKFRIDKGNLVWGRNWDLVFPVHSLYVGNLYEPCC